MRGDLWEEEVEEEDVLEVEACYQLEVLEYLLNYLFIGLVVEMVVALEYLKKYYLLEVMVFCLIVK